MAEVSAAPTRRRFFIGALLALLVAIIVMAAVAVVWYVVLDNASVPEFITGGNDGGQRGGPSTARQDETPTESEGDQAVPQQGQDASGETSPNQDQVQSVAREIKLVDIIPSPRILTLNAPGQSQRLSVQGFYSDGSVGELEGVSGARLSYISSDPSVAQVTSDGLVTGIKAAGADIAVSYGDFEATVPVLIWGEVRRIPPINPERLLEIDDHGTAIILNRVMVDLEPGYDRADAEELAASIGGEVIFEFRTFPGYVIDFGAQSETELGQALSALESDQRVASAYPDIVVSVAQGPLPPVESLLVNSLNANAYLAAGLPDAWNLVNLTPSVKPVIVFIIDTEFPHALPLDNDAAAAVIFNEFGSIHAQTMENIEVPIPVLENGNFHVIDLVDGLIDTQHGTAVASIIAAANNSPVIPGGFSGVISSIHRLEYDIVFYAIGEELGFLEDGKDTTNTIITALGQINALEQIEPYKKQIAVVNISQALNCNKPWLDCFITTDPVADSENDAKNGFEWKMFRLMMDMEEVTFVVSAGNDSDNVKNRRTVPAVFSKYLNNVITVGGTTKVQAWSGLSNWGKEVTIGAPYTVEAVDTNPADGDEDEVCQAIDENSYTGYSECSGTSFAAPLVSGTVALIKSIDPTKKPDQIKSLLVSTAHKSRYACVSGPTPTPRPTNAPVPPGIAPTPTPSPAPTRIPCLSPDLQLPVLNAGNAIRKLMDISAEIPLEPSKELEQELQLPGYVKLSLPIRNSGSHTLIFQLEGTAVSGSVSSVSRQIATKPMRVTVPPGATNGFDAEFWADIDGEWEISLELYNVRDFFTPRDPASMPLDAKTFTVKVISQENPDREVVGQATPTPPLTATPADHTPTAVGAAARLGSPETDRTALGALFYATDGQNWINNTHWMSNKPLGQWYGVTTTSDGRVSRVELGENQLIGNIPLELGNLTELTYLVLNRNHLSGEIPPELGHLGKLETLELARNSLGGEIPRELRNLTQLEWLGLGGNQLTGEIPRELGRLTNLTGIYLWENQIRGEIPVELGNLTKLNELSLGKNRLSGQIPSSLGKLVNLTGLFLYENQLRGVIPPEFGDLVSLTVLSLYGNQLTGGIPQELGSLSNLNALSLWDNQLTGTIPMELGNLKNLRILRLSQNQLNGCIPSSVRSRLDMNESMLGGHSFC